MRTIPKGAKATSLLVDKYVYHRQSSLVNAILAQEDTDLFSWEDVSNLRVIRDEDELQGDYPGEWDTWVSHKTPDEFYEYLVLQGEDVLDDRQQEDLTWVLVHDALAHRLKTLGEVVLQTSQGDWWAVRSMDNTLANHWAIIHIQKETGWGQGENDDR